MRWPGPLLVAALAMLAGGIAHGGQAASSSGPCEMARGMPGPEDIELDAGDARGPRLIVSSHERRRKDTTGALFGVPLVNGALGAPRPLELVDRDDVPFRPHGISLVAAAGPPRLYVVNHVTGADHAIEVFEIDGDRLRFRRRLAHPLLTAPNDVVALPDGEVYVTNTGSPLAMLLGFRWGNVAHFDGERWAIAAEGIGFANGLAVNAAGDRVYVAGFGDQAIHEYPRNPDTGALEERLRAITVGSGVDNLTWADDHTLMVAAHPKLFAFLRHARNPASRSPSEVYAVDVGDARVTRYPVDAVSAASTAILYQGRLYLGQVFDDAVVACPLPSPG
jgi:arylesterase/paraoxonase